MKPVTERIMAKVVRQPHATLAEPCWVFTGTRTPGGYGRIGVGSKTAGTDYTHRVMFRESVGPIPSGYQIDHLCRVRACCNPAHLEAVTRQENIARGDCGKHTRERTHCPHGHPYDEANTYVWNGMRYCRACHKVHTRNSQLKNAGRN